MLVAGLISNIKQAGAGSKRILYLLRKVLVICDFSRDQRESPRNQRQSGVEANKTRASETVSYGGQPIGRNAANEWIAGNHPVIARDKGGEPVTSKETGRLRYNTPYLYKPCGQPRFQIYPAMVSERQSDVVGKICYVFDPG